LENFFIDLEIYQEISTVQLENLATINSKSTASSLNSILKSLETNRDLTKIPDNILHFGKRHMSMASRIFYWQTTQNYLAALKWFILDDLVSQQTKFNSVTTNSIKNIFNLMNGMKDEYTIPISELKKLEVKVNENYNELKDMLIQKDLNTNEYLLSRIAELEEQIKELRKK